MLRSSLLTSSLYRAGRQSLRMSSSVGNDGKLYELRVYKIRPSNMKKVMEATPKLMEVRVKHSPLLGYFFSEVGGLNEAVHIWEYDGYGQRAQVRKNLAADPNWAIVSAPAIVHFESQDNLSLRLFPWSKITEKITPGGVYFLYRFQFPADTTCSSMSSSLQKFISDADLTSVGCWREEIGPDAFRSAYAVFHSPDFDSKKNPALACPNSWDELNGKVEQVGGRLLSAAPWSAWK